MECLQRLTDCLLFDSKHGHCKALSDTRFNGVCPFYKNKEMLNKELIGIGRGELHPLKNSGTTLASEYIKHDIDAWVKEREATV